MFALDACILAVKNGNLVDLQRAHENGCPWEQEIMAAALHPKRLLQWMDEDY